MLNPSNDNWLDSTVCSLVKQAIALEESYKEMLPQGDEVDYRIKLWGDAIEICKIDSRSTSHTCI
jgi:hypothetical protein